MMDPIELKLFNNGYYGENKITNMNQVFEIIAKHKHVYFKDKLEDGQFITSICGDIVAVHPETNSITVKIVDTLRYARDIKNPSIRIIGEAIIDHINKTCSIIAIYNLIVASGPIKED